MPKGGALIYPSRERNRLPRLPTHVREDASRGMAMIMMAPALTIR
jgi:hypothetical protein